MTKSEKFILCNSEQYKKDIISELSFDNDDYHMKKKDIFDEYSVGDKIHKIEFSASNISIVPEDDQFRVVADGVSVGYIKRGSLSKFKRLSSDPEFKKYDLEISFGKYLKVCENYYDGELFLESGEDDLSVSLYIVSNIPSPAAAAAPTPSPAAVPKKKGLFVGIFGRKV